MEAQKTIDQLAQELEAAHNALTEAGATISDLKKENKSLRKENAQLKKEPALAKKESFEHGEDRYEILVGSVHIPGHGKMTALELSTDAEAQDKLVKSNSGIIKKIV